MDPGLVIGDRGLIRSPGRRSASGVRRMTGHRRVSTYSPVPTPWPAPGAGAQALVSLRPAIPATIRPMHSSRAVVAGSLNTSMPSRAVPTAPMPTHTA